MTTADQVYTRLCDIALINETKQQVLPLCTSALNYVLDRLKDGVSADNSLVAVTAAALAYYDYCAKSISKRSGTEYFKAGDVVVRHELEKELEVARAVRESALVCAADILKDVRFTFLGV